MRPTSPMACHCSQKTFLVCLDLGLDVLIWNGTCGSSLLVPGISARNPDISEQLEPMLAISPPNLALIFFKCIVQMKFIPLMLICPIVRSIRLQFFVLAILLFFFCIFQASDTLSRKKTYPDIIA